MKKQNPPSDVRDRKDHYAPQGYLRGFIHPERERHPKPHHVLDIKRNEWSERSPSQIGWERGFYDYSPDSRPDGTAEDTFRYLENQLPAVRERVRAKGHESWTEHRVLLVSFAAMMAARSPLFRSQSLSRILPSMAADPQGEALAKNLAITQMRHEILRRPKEWEQYDWVLGFTTNPAHPFITSDQGVGMWGNGLTLADAYAANDFWLWCPLSWDMCMIASSRPLTAESTSELREEHVAEIQRLTRLQAAVFLASPTPLPHL